MQSLVCIKPGQLDYRQASEPVPEKGYSILEIKRVGVCGTDLHAFEGTQPYFEYPRILGHELAAVIHQTDKDTGFVVGEAVTTRLGAAGVLINSSMPTTKYMSLSINCFRRANPVRQPRFPASGQHRLNNSRQH